MQLSSNPIALIDADILVYIAAFACQKNTTLLKPDGSTKKDVFYLPENVGQRSINKAIDNVNNKLSPREINVVISNSNKELNYRNHVTDAAKIYKQTRKERPFFYKHMRSYLINNYNAIITEKDEGDDLIGRIAYCDYLDAIENDAKADVVMCSIDKDFKQFPGYLFNLNTHEINYSDFIGFLTYSKNAGIDGRGFLFFCAQMLMGDTSDNILGIYGVGPKKAYNLLHDADTYKEAWSRTVELYKLHGISDKQIKAHATLLWITHEDGRLLPHSHRIQDLF